MARKKKSKIPSYVKYIFIGILIIGIGFVAVDRTRHLFQKISYFEIKSIAIDPSLEFISRSDLKNLIGKNIFTIDLQAVEKRLKYKYPQASQLKVMRRFPNQISVVAKPRLPVAQLPVGSKTVVIDGEGVILEVNATEDSKLASISGAKLKNPKLVLGLPLRSSNLWVALKIIDNFSENAQLDQYTIAKMNVTNLSKIEFTLANDLDVIMDRDKISQKIRVLGIVLSQGQVDFNTIKYIDLRFKEPVLGKK